MRPLTRHNTVTRVHVLSKDRRLPAAFRAGAAGVRFSRGSRTRVMRAMRLAWGAQAETTL